MQITSLDISGLKGRELSAELKRLNLVTGENGSGKTSVLDAVRFGLHGYTPSGRNADALAKLAGPDGIRVGLSLDDGFAVRRSLTVGATVTQKVSVNGATVPKAKAQELIAQHCGAFALALNLADFLGETPENKRKLVLGLCEAASATDLDTMLSRLEIALLDLLVEPAGSVASMCRMMHGVVPSEATREQLAELAENVWGSVGDQNRQAWTTMQARLAKVGGSDAVATVTAWIEEAKALVRDHQRGRDEAEGAARRITEDKNRAGADAEPIAKLRERIAKLDRDHQELVGRIGAAQGREQAINAASRSVDRYSRDLAEASANLHKTQAELARDFDREIEDLNQRADALAPADAGDAITALQASNTALAEARSLLHLRQQRYAAASSKVESLTGDIQHHEAELERLNGSTARRSVERLHKIAAYDLPAVVAELVQELLAEFRATLEDENARIEGIKFDLAMFRDELTEAQQVRDEAERDVAESQQAVDDATKQYQRDMDANNVARDARRQADDLRREANTLANRRDALKADLQRYQRDQERAAENHRAARDELALLTAEAIDDVDELTRKRDAVAADLQAMRDRLGAKERSEALESELQECVRRAESERVALDLAGKLKDAVRVIRDDITAGQVRPLLATMDRFLEAAGLDARCYCDLQTDTGRAIFDLGWERGGTRVSVDVLSGGESALFAAALAYALVVLDGSPLRVLAIEADALDAANLERMLNAMADLSADVSNVLVATCHEPASLSPEWHTIELSRTAAAAAV